MLTYLEKLQQALRVDPLSPLLLPNVAAAEMVQPRDVLTIDNVQLGTIVQRGPDWDEGDDDGGKDCCGVVVKLKLTRYSFLVNGIRIQLVRGEWM